MMMLMNYLKVIIGIKKMMNRSFTNRRIRIIKNLVPVVFVLLAAFKCDDDSEDYENPLSYYIQNQTDEDMMLVVVPTLNINSLDTFDVSSNSNSLVHETKVNDMSDLEDEIFQEELINTFVSVNIYQEGRLIKTYEDGSAFLDISNWYLRSDGESYNYYYFITKDSLDNWK